MRRELVAYNRYLWMAGNCGSRPFSRTASTIALVHLREGVDFKNALNLGQQAVQQLKVGFSRQAFDLFGASTAWNSLLALAKLVLFNGNVVGITWRRNCGWLY